MIISEILQQPPADEIAGNIRLKTPLPATQIATGGKQQQGKLPAGTIVHLIKKNPRKRTVMFSVGGKQMVTSAQFWAQAVGL